MVGEILNQKEHQVFCGGWRRNVFEWKEDCDRCRDVSSGYPRKLSMMIGVLLSPSEEDR